MADKLEKLIHDSFTPLYHQLKEIILEKIENGDLGEGDMIPSENELQQAYDVSRATVRNAIQLLVNEGLMEKKKGKGTFVKRRKIEEQLPVLKSFTEEMIGRNASKKIISAKYIKAPPAIGSHLGLAANERVFSLKRLMMVDHKPLGILHSYVPEKYKLDSDEDYTKSLYRILEKKGIRLKEAEQTIEASISNKEQTRFIKQKKPFPVLVIRRKAYSVSGEVVEYVTGVYHADRYRYHCKLTRF
jgi:GntR family transcriptional regulator